ncbi:transmembrane protein 71 isoform X4 [Papio anubis]|uniref:transmembrane protein 71 isoform X4 n=1 Tax=Papio anubis TaxID=9555 RepID=UPI0012AD5C8F|nr:transmembrane protein 71 isoform X4 [Papio anubis]XP_021798334.2 transmembrane protein 71 isoform X4 [Papio anubis]
MYRISQLMSTPVASSSRLEREYAGELSPTCIFPSFTCDSLDGDHSFECSSVDPLTGSHYICRRSPRLLTNGYYIWNEDSFLCDKDGNITLNPSQTSVMYKENLVRIFRKKKRIRHPFSSLFNLSTSKSWLHGSIFCDVDSSPSEDNWLEGIKRLDTDHCNGNADGLHCSPTDDWESGKMNAESVITSSSSHIVSQPPGGNTHGLSPQSQLTASERFQENSSDHSETSLLQEVFFQTILLAVCLIISACARCEIIVSQPCQLFQNHCLCSSHIHTHLHLRPVKTRTIDFIFVSTTKALKIVCTPYIFINYVLLHHFLKYFLKSPSSVCILKTATLSFLYKHTEKLINQRHGY